MQLYYKGINHPYEQMWKDSISWRHLNTQIKQVLNCREHTSAHPNGTFSQPPQIS